MGKAVIYMNKIITISREFGSGGREFGCRLAENLGIKYYDKEIISKIAAKADLSEGYVREVVEKRPMPLFPMTIGATFAAVGVYYPLMVEESVYTAQTEVLQELAEQSDCVIVGRCADYILRSYNPFKIFVYADMPSRIKRCMERSTPEERLTEKEMKKKINNVDESRAKYYDFYTGQKWGARQNYNVCINTTGMDIGTLAEAYSHMLK